MATWMITRTGFALGGPDSSLVQISQPLGGEIPATPRSCGTHVSE